ncbi:MAG TPA: peptidase, partial [Pedobacter sp.]
MKKQFLSLSAAFMLCLGCVAQNKNAAQFSTAIDKENAYKHLSVLASDEYEGRETGKKGAWMAADYIKKYFKSIGLTGPVNGDYFQPIDMFTNSLSQMTFSVNGQAKEYGKDFVISSSAVGPGGFNFSTPEVIFAGYGLNKEGYNDYEGIELAGKVVMIFAAGDPTLKRGTPAETDRAARRKAMSDQQEKIKYLAEHKAAAVILIDLNLDHITEAMKAAYSGEGQPFLKVPGSTEKQQKMIYLPSVRISSATANEILKAANTSVASLQEKIVSSARPASQTVKTTLSGSTLKNELKVRA